MPLAPSRLLLCALLALAACGPGRQQTGPVSAGPGAAPEGLQAEASSAPPLVEVTTTRARRGSIERRVVASGSLLALRQSHIGAEVRGRIERVFVRAADRVEAGDPLFQIDPEPYEVALRQAQAGLDLAAAERRQIEADVARLSALHQKAIVAADELQRSRTAVAVARAREQQAIEAVALAKHNLGDTLVHAPFSGSIAERLADEGTTALVQPQTIVVVLQETAELEARVNIPESELATVRAGDPATLLAQGLAAPIETSVGSVGDTVDPNTRTYRVTMRISNPDHALKAGTFVHVEIRPRATRDALMVPREAIRSEGGHSRVLIVDEGTVVAVPVDLGAMSDSEAEVLRGLDAGAEVLVGEAARNIAPGMRVRVVGRAAAS